MMTDHIKQVLDRHGFKKFGVVSTEDFEFHRSFYDTCSTNHCGKFGTNWSCPPGVGDFEDLVAVIRGFRHGLVAQTIWPLADSFDLEGMFEATEKHNMMLRAVVDDLYPLLNSTDGMTLSVGACTLCDECGYQRNEPCPTPEKAFGALEAHGVDVAALLKHCGLEYDNGPNTVSYVGVVLFNQPLM